jgi:hypothetical protein
LRLRVSWSEGVIVHGGEWSGMLNNEKNGNNLLGKKNGSNLLIKKTGNGSRAVRL